MKKLNIAIGLLFTLTTTTYAASPAVKSVRRAAENTYSSVARKVGVRSEGSDSSVLFGGPSASALLLQGTLGFTNLPRLGVHYGVNDFFSIGGVLTFDLTYYNFLAVVPNLQFLVPMNLTFSRDRFVAGMRIEPGFGIAFVSGTALPSFLLDLESNLGGRVGGIAKIGGGLNIPLALTIAPTTAVVAIPIFFGPAFEINPIPELGIHADLKFGPIIHAGAAGAVVNFGMRLGFGVTYEL